MVGYVENPSSKVVQIHGTVGIPFAEVQAKVEAFKTLFSLSGPQVRTEIQGHWHTAKEFIDVDFGRWSEVLYIASDTVQIRIDDKCYWFKPVDGKISNVRISLAL